METYRCELYKTHHKLIQGRKYFIFIYLINKIWRDSGLTFVFDSYDISEFISFAKINSIDFFSKFEIFAYLENIIVFLYIMFINNVIRDEL